MRPEPVSAPDAEAASVQQAAAELAGFLGPRPRTVVLSGAGLSTASGIPDYRDPQGAWKRRPPVQHADFVRSPAVRRRYWARSLLGWPAFAAAEPNPGHRALARLEQAGRLGPVVTQNVDGLHQRAGSRRVLDLHGRLDTVVCLGCGQEAPRAALQRDLLRANPAFGDGARATPAPDGDADVEGGDLSGFEVPGCADCGGTLKPGVVFFGGAVPRERVEQAYAWVAEAEGLLVVGSSLMVFSGWRFVREAAERGVPVAILNLGVTRGDALATLRLAAPCAPVLEAAAARLLGGAPEA